MADESITNQGRAKHYVQQSLELTPDDCSAEAGAVFAQLAIACALLDVADAIRAGRGEGGE